MLTGDLTHCSIYAHRDALEADRVPQVRRWSREDYHDYPYRSHGQPLLAYLALAGCMFVLLVANGAALWNGFHLLPFLSSYLTVRVSYLGIR
jgi:amino acid transporter